MKLAKKLSVVNPPRTFILDKTGEIVFSHDGYELRTEKIYEAKIRELLNLPELGEKIPELEDCSSCGGCK